jgi:hypothetical protein
VDLSGPSPKQVYTTDFAKLESFGKDELAIWEIFIAPGKNSKEKI